VQAIQHLLFEARRAVIGAAANTAIDRAKQVLARANPEVAARIDQPITLRLTPRDVAIQRSVDPRVSSVPTTIAPALLDGLAELTWIAWRSQERPARPYGASQTFAVGELVEHPKFGRGTVLSVATQHVEVEFPDGKYTLVHARK